MKLDDQSEEALNVHTSIPWKVSDDIEMGDVFFLASYIHVLSHFL